MALAKDEAAADVVATADGAATTGCLSSFGILLNLRDAVSAKCHSSQSSHISDAPFKTSFSKCINPYLSDRSIRTPGKAATLSRKVRSHY